MELPALVRELIELRALEPAAVARILGCRLQLVDDDEDRATYKLVGGDPVMFDDVELRWGKDPAGGTLLVRLGLVEVPLADFEPLVKDLPTSFIPPDPRDPDAPAIDSYRIPLGELRLIYAQAPDPRITGFAVDQFPIVRWERR